MPKKVVKAKHTNVLPLRLGPALDDDIRMIAKNEGISVSDFVRRSLKTAIDQYKRDRDIHLDTTLRVHYIEIRGNKFYET